MIYLKYIQTVFSITEIVEGAEEEEDDGKLLPSSPK